MSLLYATEQNRSAEHTFKAMSITFVYNQRMQLRHLLNAIQLETSLSQTNRTMCCSDRERKVSLVGPLCMYLTKVTHSERTFNMH